MRYVYRVVCFVVFVALGLLVPKGAAAQVAEPLVSPLRSAVLDGIDVPDQAEAATQLAVGTGTQRLREAVGRPSALVPLYASLGVLQALDVHSTNRGLAAGGREANPAMRPIVGHHAAFIGVKAATTAGVILASERLWRGQNRKAAIALTVLTNIGLAAVVAHNYRAAR